MGQKDIFIFLLDIYCQLITLNDFLKNKMYNRGERLKPNKGLNMSDEEKVVSLSSGRKKGKNNETSDKKQEQSKQAESVFCSFCGRPNQMVIKMIKGPNVNICSECVMICVQYFILEDKIASSDVQKILDSFWKGAGK